jgi:hypothetical protein
MAIPFIEDLIAWLYQFLRRAGAALAFTGLLLGAVMIGIAFGTGELPHWSALRLSIPLPQTSIAAIDGFLAFSWEEPLSIPASLLAIGAMLNLIFGRRARQIAKAEADLYSSPAPRARRAS